MWLDGVPPSAQLQHVTDFVLAGFQHGYGSNQGVKSSTILGMLMGIRHFFLASGRSFPADHPQIRMLLKGIGRLDKPPARKAPVSVGLLEACFASLSMHSPSDQALWGVLCLSFFFLLRRSEITATNDGKFRWFALRAADVVTVDHADRATVDASLATSVHIRLRGSKTNQDGQVTARMLQRSGHSFLCPVLGAVLLLRARQNLPTDLPVATYMSEHGAAQSVSARKVATTIQNAALRTGCDPHAFSSHSLRSGGATNMYRAGIDALTIQFHGRWASDTFKIYTRLCSESVATAASRMVGGAKSSTTL